MTLLMACSTSQLQSVETIKMMEIAESVSVESISAAPTNAFYSESSFTGEELVCLFTER